MNIANRSIKLLWIFIFNTESEVRLDNRIMAWNDRIMPWYDVNYCDLTILVDHSKSYW